MNIYLDLDGPVLDVSYRYYRLYQFLVEKYKGKPLKQSEYWRMKRGKIPERQIFEWSSFMPKDIEVAIQERLERIELPELLKYDRVQSNVEKILDSMRLHYRLVLVTVRRNRDNLFWELGCFGLQRFFNKIYCGYKEGADWKAKKDLILSDDRFDSRYAVIVGDTEVDILAGKKLGIYTVGVLNGIRNKSFLLELTPDFIIDNLSELPGLMKNISFEKKNI